MPKQRILYIDLLKLFTIFLVLWGHAIMHFQPDFHDSYIFRTIYAFHMPLFMMLSGYFAVSSMELSPKDFFPKKFRQLLLPCISWAIVCWLVITSGLIEGEFHLELTGLFAGWIGLIDNFWFLKSCFICYTLTWLCWRFGRYKLPAMVVALVLCTMQGRFFLNTMFPSFLLGVFLRQSAPFEQWMARHWYVPSSAFVALLVCNLYFVEKYPYPLRLALGLSGALSFFILFKFLFSNATQNIYIKLAKLGRATLGIYTMQAILLEYLLPRYLDLSALPMTAVILAMPVLSLLTFAICYLIYETICSSKLMGCLMFGLEYKKQ